MMQSDALPALVHALFGPTLFHLFSQIFVLSFFAGPIMFTSFSLHALSCPIVKSCVVAFVYSPRAIVPSPILSAVPFARSPRVIVPCSVLCPMVSLSLVSLTCPPFLTPSYEVLHVFAPFFSPSLCSLRILLRFKTPSASLPL